jgi:hypothetical protein
MDRFAGNRFNSSYLYNLVKLKFRNNAQIHPNPESMTVCQQQHCHIGGFVDLMVPYCQHRPNDQMFKRLLPPWYGLCIINSGY